MGKQKQLLHESLMKFNMSNYKVASLLLSTRHTHRIELTESSPVEKDMGILVDEKVNKANSVCSQPRKPATSRAAPKEWSAG